MPTFTNKAQLTYNGNTTNSNPVTGQITAVLSASKTAVNSEYSVGDTVTFVISVVNSGTVSYSGLTVTDNLGGYSFGSETLYPLTYKQGSVLYYVNGVLQTAPAVTAGPLLVISNLSVPANGNAVIVFAATVNEFAPLETESSITNTAVISGCGVTNELVVEATVEAKAAARLTITKSLCPLTVVENSRITYTFTIENYGNTAAVSTDDVVVSDTFSPILDALSVTFDGVYWESPANYTYDTATGEFSTVSGQVTVPSASFSRDPVTGAWAVTPGVSTLVVTGTI